MRSPRWENAASARVSEVLTRTAAVPSTGTAYTEYPPLTHPVTRSESPSADQSTLVTMVTPAARTVCGSEAPTSNTWTLSRVPIATRVPSGDNAPVVSTKLWGVEVSRTGDPPGSTPNSLPRFPAPAAKTIVPVAGDGAGPGSGGVSVVGDQLINAAVGRPLRAGFSRSASSTGAKWRVRSHELVSSVRYIHSPPRIEAPHREVLAADVVDRRRRCTSVGLRLQQEAVGRR